MRREITTVSENLAIIPNYHGRIQIPLSPDM